LYQQTINAVLRAAELLELPHHLQLIMAQPKNEIMVHFPVLMDSGEYRLFKATAFSTTTSSARTKGHPLPR